MIKVKRMVLPNGLRVLLVHQPGALTTTVMAAVEAGSKYETKNINGISHFLEHMCFKGTKKRPRAIDIASELDGLGAHYNAFTSQEATSYYAKVKSEFFPAALDVVADLYLNPVFDTAEIEKEKGVIVEEINMYEDLPQRKVQELFMELVYGDQPAGWGVVGRKEVVNGLKREDFVKYRAKHYAPKATVVAISGGAPVEEALKMVKKYFLGLPSSKKGSKPRVVEKQEKPAELVFHKDSDQTHLVLGFRAFSVFDKRRYALKIMADILGGGMSSRLFQRIREEMGAAYYVNASDDLYSDHGLFTMASGAQHQKIEDVIRAALMEFGRFREELVPANELKQAKDHLTGSMFISLEGSDEIGGFYASQEVMGIPLVSPSLLARALKAVTAEEVRATARAILKPERLNLALIGPFQKRSFKSILKIEHYRPHATK